MKSIEQLLKGFRRFREKHFVDDHAHFRDLVQFGQNPLVMVVACCDSRVDPALVLDCTPGDLFVIRNVANLVPPAEDFDHYHGTSAALEFGVVNLGVRHIIVLGHAQCGGIRALLDGGISNGDSYVAKWMNIADAARRKVELAGLDSKACHRACEQQAVLSSLSNLMTYAPIRERVEQNKLKLHGWYFDIESGDLLGYNAVTCNFEAL